MFSKALYASLFIFSLVLQSSAHAAISPALGVTGAPARKDVQKPSTAAPCGKIDPATALDTSTPATADASGNVALSITDFNAGKDGSRSIKSAQVDPTGTGQSFQDATVATDGDPAPKAVGTDQLAITLPAGTKCTGGKAGNLCLMTLTTTAGFGNCIAVQQGGAAAAGGAAANSIADPTATAVNSTAAAGAAAGSTATNTTTTTSGKTGKGAKKAAKGAKNAKGAAKGAAATGGAAAAAGDATAAAGGAANAAKGAAATGGAAAAAGGAAAAAKGATKAAKGAAKAAKGAAKAAKGAAKAGGAAKATAKKTAAKPAGARAVRSILSSAGEGVVKRSGVFSWIWA